MPIRPASSRALAVVLLAGCGASRRLAPKTPRRPTAPPRKSELRGVETNLKASEEEQRKIEADVEAIKLDRARLNQALLETTAKIQKTESDRAEATARLTKADGRRDGARGFDRRAARPARRACSPALQRMTHDAPPAILVRPDDMAAAVRAASVVNTLIGDIKGEADALSRDLGESLRPEAHDRATSATNSPPAPKSLAVDKTRLDALVDARQKALARPRRARSPPSASAPTSWRGRLPVSRI